MPHFHRLFQAALLAGGLAATVAVAQTTPDQSGAHRQHSFDERFNAANITHDGRLTQAQAEAGNMPEVARHFDSIDKQHKGYVTIDDLRAFRQQMRAARAAQRQQTQ
jgi:hypothetical protein